MWGHKLYKIVWPEWRNMYTFHVRCALEWERQITCSREMSTFSNRI